MSQIITWYRAFACLSVATHQNGRNTCFAGRFIFAAFAKYGADYKTPIAGGQGGGGGGAFVSEKKVPAGRQDGYTMPLQREREEGDLFLRTDRGMGGGHIFLSRSIVIVIIITLSFSPDHLSWRHVFLYKVVISIFGWCSLVLVLKRGETIVVACMGCFCFGIAQ